MSKITTWLLVAIFTAMSPVLVQGQAAAAAPASPAPGRGGGQHFDTTREFKTPASVKAIACSADGKLIAVASGSATVLDGKTGKTIATLKPESGEVTALALSPDGSIVAAGTNGGQIKLFDVRRALLVSSLAMGSVRSLAFSPDGKLLAACGESAEDLKETRRQLGEHPSGPGRVKIWDVKTAAVKFDLDGHSQAYVVAFSADGKILASAGSWLKDGQAGSGALLWNTKNGEKLRAIPIDADRGADAVAFSPDGKHIAITAPSDGDGGVIAVALVESGDPLWSKKISQRARPLAFLPNDSAIISLCKGQLWYMDEKTGELLMVLNPGDKDGKNGRWNDFASAKQNHMQVMGGEGREGKGTVYVLDPDNRDPAPPPPPKEGL